MSQEPPTYNLGPDEEEVVRLTAQHEIMKAAYGNLILAPLDLTRTHLRILDSATANGLWLQDIAPSLSAPYELVGTDINANLFPKVSIPDIYFQVQDITTPWPTEWANSFDIVHTRVGLAGCGPFPIEQAIKNMIEMIKPGGWIQLDEMDLIMQGEQAGVGGVLGKLIQALFTMFGADPLFAGKLKGWLINAGLENVQEKLIKVPFGATSPDPEIAEKGVRSFAMSAAAVAFGAKRMGVQGFTEEELDRLSERVKAELPVEGTYGMMINVWGQKPMTT